MTSMDSPRTRAGAIARTREEDDDPELRILPEPGVRRLTGDGVVRYSRRGPEQLEQAKKEALRRLERKVEKAKLEKASPTA